MKRWLIRSVQVAALAMGGLALTGTAAHADWDSGPNVGFLNGNQSSTTVQAPVNICGNSLAIIGFASANCDGGAYAYSGNGGNSSGAGNGNGYGNADSSNKKKHKKYRNNANANASANGGGAYAYNSGNGNWTTGYNAGFLNGNQSSTTVQVPINVSCNSVALIGFASSC
ncbi:DUF320 domain-containing protein [Dactylosporangium roseum]|uniref:DUF320 domain-containing protein n=1 Tax=Dactylosporangium roseum TaxID=47989 RepID=A0ABY5ZET6_9ACTN|nr:chaplin family protein [Dactylosporangium roseum]UWZ39937.1 DUF320 domain-containing protein [Dactylosporangium roseum]